MSFKISSNQFKVIADLAKHEFGLSLNENKMYLIQNRLNKRMVKASCLDYDQYIKILHQDQNELIEFINCLTTNKTDFFRENEHFVFLRDKAIPELCQKFPQKKSIYIWCAAASTGEEPLSLAMTLEKVCPAYQLDYKILATDIDTDCLTIAKAGIYPQHRIYDIPTQELQAFFWKGIGENEGKYRAKPELMRSIKYRRFNLVKDSLPSNLVFDFIFLRNVLIYFDHPTVVSVIHRVTRYLSPVGYLFVGHSESLHSLSDHLTNVVPAVYKKKVPIL